MAITNLKKIRDQIDRVDQVILTALAERIALIPDLAKVKKHKRIPIFQEKRDEQIIRRLRKTARQQDIDPDFVEEVFLSIFNESKRIQNNVMREE